ncbi:hypothetical protein U9M48_005666 [Paspalum notatum var. saurae]|uniref:Protein kinase domain-containing protein n=1 Tax=Paspalum notatum var. saurae TaxID=547442 RepID=A0AAQ3SK61_PASNO
MAARLAIWAVSAQRQWRARDGAVKQWEPPAMDGGSGGGDAAESAGGWVDGGAGVEDGRQPFYLRLARDMHRRHHPFFIIVLLMLPPSWSGAGATTYDAFYPNPLDFTSVVAANSTSVPSFSTTFVFAIVSHYLGSSNHGLAFVLSSTQVPSSRFLAVELDTKCNPEVEDIDDNHIGIDNSSLISISSASAGFYDPEDGNMYGFNLTSTKPMQVWVDYDSKHTILSVTIIVNHQPSRPLLSVAHDLSTSLEPKAVGGFRSVYRGLLPVSKQMVAIKRVSPESRQGMNEFMSEIVILGIASGLFYLHEDWEQVVIHRDIKTSNVLLDDEMNARLGDFGLARSHDHGVDAHTTRLAGTYGYIAPELARLGKATKATDVFAFGVLMMEVACARRPIWGNTVNGEPLTLADWVLTTWRARSITDTVNRRLDDYVEEIELVLKLGLLCSHPSPNSRPHMRLIMQYLERNASLPADLQPDALLSSDQEIIQLALRTSMSWYLANAEQEGGAVHVIRWSHGESNSPPPGIRNTWAQLSAVEEASAESLAPCGACGCSTARPAKPPNVLLLPVHLQPPTAAG